MVNIMDVLKPEIINLEGRRYRKPPVLTTKSSNDDNCHEAYYEDDLYYDDEPASCGAEYSNIVKVANGYKETIKDIPSFYFRFICGVGNEKRKKLENQTNTSIQVPKLGCDGDVVISGKERGGIIAATSKIKTVFEMYRLEAPAAHFLTIQLGSNERFTENFNEFKKNVLQMKLRAVDESLFQYPERIHLTLCMLTFLNKAELDDSICKLTSTTQELQEKHFNEIDSLKIRVQGIEYMNDDPSEVDVLYAKANIPDASSKFQAFVDEVVSEFSALGFSKKEHERVKLHATIINSLFRDDRNNESSAKKEGNKRTRVTFDAKPILDAYSDYFFGDFNVSTLDIAVRRTFDTDGRYKVAASIPLC